LLAPPSRGNQAVLQTACRYGGEGNPTCWGPCDRTIATAIIGPTNVNRGDTINIQWIRHSHAGGFIRFAWAPFSTSDLHSSFDGAVFEMMCKEIGGCGPTDPTQADYTDNGLPCQVNLTVPGHLTNGEWTLQWAYFGGYFNAGDYYSCVDYNIVGGPTGAKPAARYLPGDVTYPGQNKCKYFSTNQLHVCSVEPCTNAPTPGEQAGPPCGFGGACLAPTGSTDQSSGTSVSLTSTSTSTSTSSTSFNPTSSSTSTSVNPTSVNPTSSTSSSQAVTSSLPPGTCYIGSDGCSCTPGGACDANLRCVASVCQSSGALKIVAQLSTVALLAILLA